ncbi:hypothetical protein A4X13_0g8457 [Tilletia indica]|uniref:Uncharacterized protein n=1 Tax=Tilletia indica TaxID=43049 RepID=A0A177T2E3_9BASI|nr:hypothetical protein A4X13_0g8457 [Tilletia indica]
MGRVKSKNRRLVVVPGLGPILPASEPRVETEGRRLPELGSERGDVAMWDPSPEERELHDRIRRASEAIEEAELAAEDASFDVASREAITKAVREWMHTMQEYIELPNKTMDLAFRMWDQVRAVRPNLPPTKYQEAAVGAMYRASCTCGHPEHLEESEISVLTEFKCYVGGWLPEGAIEAAAEMVGQCVQVAETITDDGTSAQEVGMRAEIAVLRTEMRAHAMAALTLLGKGTQCADTVVDAAKHLYGRYIDENGSVPPSWTWFGPAALVICSERANRERSPTTTEPPQPGISQIAAFLGCETDDIRDDAWELRKRLAMPTADEEENQAEGGYT